MAAAAHTSVATPSLRCCPLTRGAQRSAELQPDMLGWKVALPPGMLLICMGAVLSYSCGRAGMRGGV